MEATTNPSFATNDFLNQPQLPMQPQRAREKSKRPQLSCNPCRARKVKCDRIQPCTACSLHQIADHCEFDLSEAERHPILQAEALKEKDKAIAQLRNEVAMLRGDPVKSEPLDEVVSFGQSGPKIKLPPRITSKKPATLGQKRDYLGEMSANIYFGSPGMASVVEEFAHLAFDRKPASLTHAVPRGTDIFAFQLATSHPFPTLWSAKDDISTLIKLLPAEEDLYFYLDAFQRRVQSCSFPHVPDECTKNEVVRFLDNVEHNAALHPDMLALLFATLAQGLQYGVYDKYGERWVAGAVETESKKSDVYIAASMQCLRLGCYMNRPTLLVIQTLVMMGPHLTNSGKFLDASALFGGTVRLAQSIGLHRDPNLLNPPAPPKEVATRKNLWWWMMHMDMQYSMSLGRPLGISSMGDCPAPEPIARDPLNQSLSNYLAQFSILGRQILSAAYLSNEQIDTFTDQLLALFQTLPDMIRFDVTWLDKQKSLPQWPLDAQAGILHAQLHNFLLLLNRQRIENARRESAEPQTDLTPTPSNSNANSAPRGRARVLLSCRALLTAFEFFQTRVQAALICWTLGQMAFNAAMILLLSMLETSDTQDLRAVERTYSTFLEMNKLGVHKLAGAAVERLGVILKEYRPGDPATETVMGQQGMMLLEDPGLQGSMPESFSPLNFQMAGGADTPGMQRSPTGTDKGNRTAASQISSKKAGRKPVSDRDTRARSSKKNISGSHRPLNDRRSSDSAAPRPPQKRKRPNRSTLNLALVTSQAGQHSFSVAQQPAIKPEALFSPIEHHFHGFSAINTPAQLAHDRIPDFETTPLSQGFTQARPNMQSFPHHHQHPASDPGDRTLDFSQTTTPGTAGTEYFDDNLQPGTHQFEFDLSGTHMTTYDHHQPYSAPAYNIPGDSSASDHHYGF